MPTTLILGVVALQTPLSVDEAGDIRDPGGTPIAVVRLMFAPEVSRLFSASPDLLLAAEAVIRLVDRGDVGTTERHDATNALRTAIARARGQEQG